MLKNKLVMNLQLFAEGEEGFQETIIPGSDEDFETGFDDYVEETEEEEEEETEEGFEEEGETTPGEPEETQTEEQKFKIKYNKEEKELTLTQMQELAQKGMNYDKKLAEIEAYQNNPGLKYMEELAQANDVTVEELVSHYRQVQEQQELQDLISKNVPEDIALEMMESKKFRAEQLKIQEEQKAQKETEERQKSDTLDFMKAFPDVKPSDVPNEVWEKVDSGMSLKQAYMENEFEKLKQENKILKQNKTNKRKAPGLGTSNSGTDGGETYDAFLDGFDNY